MLFLMRLSAELSSLAAAVGLELCLVALPQVSVEHQLGAGAFAGPGGRVRRPGIRWDRMFKAEKKTKFT